MSTNQFTAFDGHKLFHQGPLDEVVLKIKKHLGKEDTTSILIFSDETGRTIDFNFQGALKDVQKRLEVFVTQDAPKEVSGPGRPKIGVTSREISLLPQHWEWLATQQGGASAVIRKLVDEAKRKSSTNPSAKQIQEKVHRFMSSLGGDLPGFEEALRALYRKDKKHFSKEIEAWPHDLKDHVNTLAEPLFGG